MTSNIQDDIKLHFRPEFLNRVDDIVIFRSLGEKEIEKIVDIQVTHLQKLLADRKITIKLTEAAKKFIATDGYDPTYGARPLKRSIQRNIQDPLAMQILEGVFKDGDTIKVDEKKGELVFA